MLVYHIRCFFVICLLLSFTINAFSAPTEQDDDNALSGAVFKKSMELLNQHKLEACIGVKDGCVIVSSFLEKLACNLSKLIYLKLTESRMGNIPAFRGLKRENSIYKKESVCLELLSKLFKGLRPVVNLDGLISDSDSDSDSDSKGFYLFSNTKNIDKVIKEISQVKKEDLCKSGSEKSGKSKCEFSFGFISNFDSYTSTGRRRGSVMKFASSSSCLSESSASLKDSDYYCTMSVSLNEEINLGEFCSTNSGSLQFNDKPFYGRHIFLRGIAAKCDDVQGVKIAVPARAGCKENEDNKKEAFLFFCENRSVGLEDFDVIQGLFSTLVGEISDGEGSALKKDSRSITNKGCIFISMPECNVSYHWEDEKSNEDDGGESKIGIKHGLRLFVTAPPASKDLFNAKENESVFNSLNIKDRISIKYPFVFVVSSDSKELGKEFIISYIYKPLKACEEAQIESLSD